MKVEVTVLDSDCQDPMLAHGTTTISVESPPSTASPPHRGTESLHPAESQLKCSLMRKSKVRLKTVGR